MRPRPAAPNRVPGRRKVGASDSDGGRLRDVSIPRRDRRERRRLGGAVVGVGGGAIGDAVGGTPRTTVWGDGGAAGDSRRRARCAQTSPAPTPGIVVPRPAKMTVELAPSVQSVRGCGRGRRRRCRRRRRRRQARPRQSIGACGSYSSLTSPLPGGPFGAAGGGDGDAHRARAGRCRKHAGESTVAQQACAHDFVGGGR